VWSHPDFFQTLRVRGLPLFLFDWKLLHPSLNVCHKLSVCSSHIHRSKRDVRNAR
jgi:hypothetical protein